MFAIVATALFIALRSTEGFNLPLFGVSMVFIAVDSSLPGFCDGFSTSFDLRITVGAAALQVS